VLNAIQPSEKVYQSFRLEVRNPGGHSSRPIKENAIYRLAEALTRLSKYQFPARLNEVTIEYYKRMAALSSGQLAADMRAVAKNSPDRGAVSRLSQSPYHNAMLRTTCVATLLEAGHAENALPQTARAVVNCRILPGESPAEVRAALVRVLDDPKITILPLAQAARSDASPLKPEVLNAVTAAIQHFHGPQMHVFPVMQAGASDGSFFRAQGIPVYDVDGSWGISPLDDRAHGLDERLPVRAMYDDVLHWEMMIKALAGSGSTPEQAPVRTPGRPERGSAL